MEKIASFTIDHTRLLPGVYVSRRDKQGDGRVTNFDLRLTAPNREPVMDTPAIHTIEHLGQPFCARARKVIGLFILAPWAAARAFI